MREITYEDYLNFLKENDYVIIGKNKIKLHKEWKIKNYSPERDYQLEGTTVWSFKDRGDWASYRIELLNEPLADLKILFSNYELFFDFRVK
ncbi:MAG: hypothetical protein ABIK78_05385 [candidate division WOR-3 bacterium]